MKIFVPKETLRTETRVPIVPATVARLVKLGAEVAVENGIGESVQYPDEDYRAAGGTMVADRPAALTAAGALRGGAGYVRLLADRHLPGIPSAIVQSGSDARALLADSRVGALAIGIQHHRQLRLERGQ